MPPNVLARGQHRGRELSRHVQHLQAMLAPLLTPKGDERAPPSAVTLLVPVQSGHAQTMQMTGLGRDATARCLPATS